MNFYSALTLDIPRARKTLEHLIAHPEEHNQETYGYTTACGTKMCIAGTVVYQDAEAGEQVRWKPVNDVEYMLDPDEDICEWIPTKAAELLGLQYEDAWDLFHIVDNSTALATLKHWIKAAEEAQSA